MSGESIKTLRGALKSYYILTMRTGYDRLVLIEPHHNGTGVLFALLTDQPRRLTKAEARKCVRFLGKCTPRWHDSCGVVAGTLQAYCISAAMMKFNPKELLA